MTHIYYQAQPIYDIFNLKEELNKYLLNENNFFIQQQKSNINEHWNKMLNDALLRLGNYLINKDVTIS